MINSNQLYICQFTKYHQKIIIRSDKDDQILEELGLNQLLRV